MKRRRAPLSWLPIDSRLLPDIISFGHVKGIARIFLELEIGLSLVIVMGSIVIAVLKVFNL